MTRRGWLWRQWRQRLGWPGLAGSGLLVVAVLTVLAGILPERMHLTELKTRVAQARTQAATAARPEKQGAEAELTAFYQAFPSRDSAPAWLQKIFAAGDEVALGLEKGEYKLTADRGSRLLRYDINLPVHGSYMQIREFIMAALEDVPTLALRDIQFRRGSIADPAVDAQIGFALYLRETGS